MGGKPKLPNAAGDGSVRDFANKVLVTSASSFGCSCEKDVLFLS